MTSNTDFGHYIKQWRLVPDGKPIITRSSRLLPVATVSREKAMLKIATVDEEKVGAYLMTWWNGHGAARVIRHDGAAILLERATGPKSLTAIARNGNDDGASIIMCNTVADLHQTRQEPTPELVPLPTWFAALFLSPKAGILSRSAEAAERLLADPRDIVPLHGDIHHGNILDFGERGWLAIDPKGLLGERSFDYANLFCNPDYLLASAPGRLRRQVHVVAEHAGLDHQRLLQWILAWAGLSAVWFEEDQAPAQTAFALHIAQIAAAEIDRN